MIRSSASFLFAAVLCGSALAQGDARFCGSYAANASGMGGLAVKQNPACLDYGRGVHGNYQSHFDWCMKNSPSAVQGAEGNIRRLVSQCTGNAPKPAAAAAPAPSAAPKQTIITSGPTWGNTMKAAAGRVGDFQIVRWYDPSNNSTQRCSAMMGSGGREIHFYQTKGDGFGLLFSGQPGVKGQVVSISIPERGSFSYDAVWNGGNWYSAQLLGADMLRESRSPESMEVQFLNGKTTYMLSRQYMPDVFAAIAKCRKN